MRVFLVLLLCLSAIAKRPGVDKLACGSPWQFVGPSSMVSNDDFQFVEDMDGDDDDGAEDDDDFQHAQTDDSDGEDDESEDEVRMTNAAATHRLVGGANGRWYAGVANGGVWRTSNISVEEPRWECVTDNQPVDCASIAALAVAHFDPRLVAAGCGGSTSGEMSEDWNTLINGDWDGVMLSEDGGDTWAMTQFPENYNINGLLFVEPSTMIVAARSNFYNMADGGVWRSVDLGRSWERVLTKPAVDVAFNPSTGEIFAALGVERDTVLSSTDAGSTWTYMSAGLEWGKHRPYYSQLDFHEKSGSLFLATFAENPSDLADTESFVWAYDFTANTWAEVRGTPDRMDCDRMPKDKISVLGDPTDPDVIYVAANAEALCFRVDWKKGQWTYMGANDTADSSEPHGDCRDLQWDHLTDRLLLTSDGGVFQRTNPKTKGGGWRGANGDIGTMEYSYAGWDSRLRRFVAGAQDNSVQITPPAKSGSIRAMGVVGGDGNRVLIDNTHCPARMFGSAQFLDGITVLSGHPLEAVQIPIMDTFSKVQEFPYFVMPSTLNSQDPGQFLFWVKSMHPAVGPPGIYAVTVPTKSSDVVKPRLVTSVEGSVLEFLVGGYTHNVSDPSLVMGMNDTHLFRGSGKTQEISRLPMRFARPVIFHDVVDNDWVLGPLSHGNTVSLAMSPANSDVFALTGWPVDWNSGDEGIFYTKDGGKSYANIIGDLARACGTSSKVRPQGLVVIEFSDLDMEAILVGTVSGVYVTFSRSTLGEWSRVGMLSDFPYVMNMGLSYEHYSDTLVAATYGRGVYILENAKQALVKILHQQVRGSCDVPEPKAPQSSARFFPPQQKC